MSKEKWPRIEVTDPAMKLLREKEVYGFDGYLLVFMAALGCNHASVVRRGDHIEIIFWEIKEMRGDDHEGWCSLCVGAP